MTVLSDRSRIRALLLCAAALVACAWPLRAQTPTGTVQGSVLASPLNVPLPFAIVTVPQLGIERFTDQQGRFTLTSLPAGDLEIVVRRIGYEPYRGTVRIVAATATPLEVRLQQLPAQLATTTVRAMTDCPRPGAPDRDRDPVVAMLVELLRENADRYRLLVSQHAFQYTQQRAMALLVGDTVIVQQVDSLIVRSTARGGYRPGRVVQRTTARNAIAEFAMTLPTIIDLAAPEFARNHCFAYAGSTHHAGETWYQLDVRAADRIRSPDVHGSFQIDSATSELRRMDLTMSRPEALPLQLRGVDGVDVVTTFTNIAPGLAVIDKVCSLTRPRQAYLRRNAPMPAELQQLLGYEFTAMPPSGIPKLGTVAPPPHWIPRTHVSRDMVWCAP